MEGKGKSVTSPYENAIACELFDQFVNANAFKGVLSSFQKLCEVLKLRPRDYRTFYSRLKTKLHSWKAQSLWAKIDKRASHKIYMKGKICMNSKVLIIGAGPCGLRIAIEAAMLGAKVVVVEKRDRFSRNNVLHLWPYVITDLRNLGAKKFFGKFCAGSIDHISIRQLQCILLKVALCLGIEIQYNVTFIGLLEPPQEQSQERIGWRAKVLPETSSVSQYEFDVLIGADGKRNTLEGFKRKEFRGKLAIAITANFINRHTEAENRVEEISGVAFIFNQKFFQELKEKTSIDLENIVYYKDETHYFVMTAKKQSLREKGVIVNDYNDAALLLSRENVDQEALLNYAREAAAFSTNYQLPNMEFALNHYGLPDVAMFDFTSMFAAENASRIIEKNEHKLLLGLVGDSLLEPFWPTGSGCARGFLGSFDAAWMIRSWALNKMTPLEVIAERESIYRLLAQTTPENLNKNFNQYHLDPNSRYRNLNSKAVKPFQVRCYYNTDRDIKDEILEIETPTKSTRKESFVKPHTLLSWCQKQLSSYDIKIEDMTTAWKNGLALCALIHLYRPELINFHSLTEDDVLKNNQLAFEIAEQELGIPPVLTAKEMAQCTVPDKLTIVSYLAQFYEIFRYETPQKLSAVTLERCISPEEHSAPNRRTSTRFSILGKINSKFAGKKKYTLERDSSIDKENDKRKHGSMKNKKKQSPNNDKNSILLTRYDKIVSNFEGGFKVIDKTVIAEDCQEKKNKEPNLSFEEKVKKLDKKFQELSGRDRRSPVRVVNEIDRKECKDLPSVKQDIFVSKVIEMDRKLRGVDDSHSKFQHVDNSLKKLDSKLQGVNFEGTVKVSAIAEQFSSMAEHKPPEQPQPERKISRQQVQIPSGGKTCYFCNNRVYLMEQMSAENLFFHRNCFKCEYCGTSLRLGNYTFDRYGIKGGKFYCVPHYRMEKPGRARKYSAENYSSDLKSLTYLSPDQVDQPSPITLPSTEIIVKASKTRIVSTPERIEFENAVDVLSEDEVNEMEEEEVTKHNLGLPLKVDEDEESAEDSSSDGEDEAFSSDVEQELQNSAFTWDDACKLAETWKRKHSQENIMESSGEESDEIDETSDDDENGYEELQSEDDNSDGDDDDEEEESEKSSEELSDDDEEEEAGDGISTPKVEVKPADQLEFSPKRIIYNKESHPIALKSPEKIVIVDFEDEKCFSGEKENVQIPNEISEGVTEMNCEMKDTNKSPVKKQVADKSGFKDLGISMITKKMPDQSGAMDPLTEKDLSFDLKFVTVRRKKYSDRTVSQDSESSFTASSPGSPKSSTSSQTLNMLEMELQSTIVDQGPVDSSRQAPIAVDEIDETYRTETSDDTTSRPSSVLSLPDDRTPVQSPVVPEVTEDISATTAEAPKKKIPFDRSLLESLSDVKEIPGDTTLEAEKGRTKICLTSEIKSSKMRKSIEDIDIPFADEGTEDNDSESETFESPEEKFYTPLTSKKPERPKDLNIVKVTDDGSKGDLSDDTSDNILLEDNSIIYNNISTKREKHRGARLRAKSTQNDEAKTKSTLRLSQQSNVSDVFVTPRTSTSQDILEDGNQKRYGVIEYDELLKELEDRSKDQESSECKESSDEQSNDVSKADRKKSILAFLGLSSSDSKKKKKKRRPPSTESIPVEKRSKLQFLRPKDQCLQDKRKKKTQEELDSILKPSSKFFISYDKTVSPKQHEEKLDNFSSSKNTDETFSCTDDTEEELLDEKCYELCTPSTERGKQEDFHERFSRKVQKAAQRLQRQAEMKRLRMAQEIQRKLEEIAVRQQELEERGITVEKALRNEGEEANRDETDLMQEWFNLVHEKNILIRCESELMVCAKELELEDRHGRLQQLLREKMVIDELSLVNYYLAPDQNKTAYEIEEEGKILSEMLDVVEQRDALVAMLEEERLREKEEDKEIEEIMDAKGFCLSPVGILKTSGQNSSKS